MQRFYFYAFLILMTVVGRVLSIKCNPPPITCDVNMFTKPSSLTAAQLNLGQVRGEVNYLSIIDHCGWAIECETGKQDYNFVPYRKATHYFELICEGNLNAGTSHWQKNDTSHACQRTSWLESSEQWKLLQDLSGAVPVDYYGLVFNGSAPITAREYRFGVSDKAKTTVKFQIKHSNGTINVTSVTVTIGECNSKPQCVMFEDDGFHEIDPPKKHVLIAFKFDGDRKTLVLSTETADEFRNVILPVEASPTWFTGTITNVSVYSERLNNIIRMKPTTVTQFPQIEPTQIENCIKMQLFANKFNEIVPKCYPQRSPPLTDKWLEKCCDSLLSDDVLDYKLTVNAIVEYWKNQPITDLLSTTTLSDDNVIDILNNANNGTDTTSNSTTADTETSSKSLEDTEDELPWKLILIIGGIVVLVIIILIIIICFCCRKKHEDSVLKVVIPYGFESSQKSKRKKSSDNKNSIDEPYGPDSKYDGAENRKVDSEQGSTESEDSKPAKGKKEVSWMSRDKADLHPKESSDESVVETGGPVNHEHSIISEMPELEKKNNKKKK